MSPVLRWSGPSLPQEGDSRCRVPAEPGCLLWCIAATVPRSPETGKAPEETHPLRSSKVHSSQCCAVLTSSPTKRRNPFPIVSLNGPWSLSVWLANHKSSLSLVYGRRNLYWMYRNPKPLSHPPNTENPRLSGKIESD